jgi:hypothetical protein
MFTNEWNSSMVKKCFDAVAELLGHVAGVVGEGLGRLDRLPAAVAVLEGLGQVPVVQGGEGLDPCL